MGATNNSENIRSSTTTDNTVCNSLASGKKIPSVLNLQVVIKFIIKGCLYYLFPTIQWRLIILSEMSLSLILVVIK